MTDEATTAREATMGLCKIGGDEATRLGQHWMGPEHTLLGILRGNPDDVARRALEQAGVDAAMVEGWITRSGTTKEKDTVTPNPMWQTIHGRAEGIAAGLGADRTGTVSLSPGHAVGQPALVAHRDDRRHQGGNRCRPG